MNWIREPYRFPYVGTDPMGTGAPGRGRRRLPMYRRARLLTALVLLLAIVALLVAAVPPPVAGFPTRTGYDRSLSAPGAGPVAVGDLNRDGLPDIVAADARSGMYYVFLQTPMGLPASPTFTFQGAAPQRLLLADMDNDGALDIVALGSNATVLMYQDNGTFGRTTTVPTGGGMQIVVANLNLAVDDAKDVALLAPDLLEIWFQNASGGAWSARADVNVTVSGYHDLDAADLNGDGTPDLVLAKPFALLVFPQTPAGLDFNRFPQVLDSFNGSVSLGLAGVAGDARPEVVMTTVDSVSGYAELSVYTQDVGSFNRIAKIAGPFTGGFAVGDLNDDGVPDLAAATLDQVTSAQTVTVFLQRFTGGFDAVPSFQLALGSATSDYGIATGRFSGRTFSDLLVRTDGAILLFQQEDLPPVLIQAIPSSLAFNAGGSGAALVDLRNYFADDHGVLVFQVVYEENPSVLHATIAADGHHLDFAAAPGWFGKGRFQVAATDGVPTHGPVPSNGFDVIVNAIPTVTSSPPAQVRAGERFQYQVTISDPYPAADLHSFMLLEAPAGMTIDAVTGLVEWTPSTSDVGAHTVVVRVADSHGGTADQTFALQVVPALVPPPTMPIVAAAALGAIAALAAGAFASENVKYGLLMIFIPLYSKIKREQVLDHFVRGQIYGYVLANPGEHYNAIKAALNLTNGSLAHHLKTLEREHFIKSKRFGLYRRFYPMNMKIPEDGFFTPNEIQKTIVDLIRSVPGITQKEIAERLGLTPPTVNYHVGILSEHQAIRVERAGRKTHCFVVEGGSAGAGSTSGGGPAAPGPSAPRPPA